MSLQQKIVLVTRSAQQSSAFTELLEAAGAKVMEMPTLEIGPPSSWQALDAAIAHLDQFHWLILTSANGVDAFFQRLARQGKTLNSDNSHTALKIAVVGKKTAKVLQSYGHSPNFIPPDFVADALVSHFPDRLHNTRILFPRVESGGRELLAQQFSAQGAQVTEVAAYESRCPETIDPAALAALRDRKIAAVTFASSKTVQHFCQLLQQSLGPRGLETLQGVVIASIGPQTSQTCMELLGRVDVEAQEYTLEGLTAAIVTYFAQGLEKGFEGN